MKNDSKTSSANFGEENTLPVREVMDIRQAAEYFGISTDALYKYATTGFVPGFKLGNRWRFRKSALDNWMDAQSGVSPTAPMHKPPAKKLKGPTS